VGRNRVYQKKEFRVRASLGGVHYQPVAGGRDVMEEAGENIS
jgi:hypothetical protein